MHSISITVPIPKSNENRRKSNAILTSVARKKDVKDSIRACNKAMEDMGETINELNLPWTNANVKVLWYHRTRRFRDMWNMVGSLKGTLDGIVRSGILADDDLVQPPLIFRKVDKDYPRVVLVLTPIEERKYRGVI